MAAPLESVAFLTVVPIPRPGHGTVGSMGWALAFFPLVGAAIGGLLVGLDLLLGLVFPAPVGAALLLAGLLAVTGALHLDGLMDSFDGLFGGRDPTGRMAIMRDSRVGSYGIAAAVSVLLLEFACLLSLSSPWRAGALALALCLSRWAMVATLWAFPAAEAGGLAASLKPELRMKHMVVASLLGLGFALGCLGWVGMLFGLGTVLMVLLWGRLVVSRVGGVTGDSCGAVGQLVEAAVLVACTAACVPFLMR